MHGINSGSLFSKAHCVKSFQIGNTMDTFTIISNFLIIAVVFLTTCPDESKGYLTLNWSNLYPKAPEFATKHFNLWRTAKDENFQRQKMAENYSHSQDADNDHPGNPLPSEIPISSKPPDEDCNDPSNPDCEEKEKPTNHGKRTVLPEDEEYLSVIPLNKSPTNNEESTNVKRSVNGHPGFHISRL